MSSEDKVKSGCNNIFWSIIAVIIAMIAVVVLAIIVIGLLIGHIFGWTVFFAYWIGIAALTIFIWWDNRRAAKNNK
jgi:hypothetical protein